MNIDRKAALGLEPQIQDARRHLEALRLILELLPEHEPDAAAIIRTAQVMANQGFMIADEAVESYYRIMEGKEPLAAA